jgi:hypothetical protein
MGAFHAEECPSIGAGFMEKGFNAAYTPPL